MKRLMALLLVTVIAVCLVACDKGDSLRKTEGGDQSTTVNSQLSTDNITTTTHIHPEHTTTNGVGGSSHEGDVSGETELTTNGGESEGSSSGADITTTTVQGESTTSNPTITTTTKKGETTTSNRVTTTKIGGVGSTTTTTTKKTTTTTTKKTTTTTTKKTTTTAKKHTFSSATYSVVDINTHKVTGKCSTCGATTSQTEAHSWSAWKYDSYPTATKQGVKYRACTGCKYEQVTYVPATSVNVSNLPQEMFALVNAERAKQGLPAFSYYSAGQSGANVRAKELLEYFSHNRPNGTKWWTAPGFDSNVCQAGAENIAIGYGSPKDVMAAFMASADHKKNILSTTYTHIVIAYYDGAWVQIFVKPR